MLAFTIAHKRSRAMATIVTSQVLENQLIMAHYQEAEEEPEMSGMGELPSTRMTDGAGGATDDNDDDDDRSALRHKSPSEAPPTCANDGDVVEALLQLQQSADASDDEAASAREMDTALDEMFAFSSSEDGGEASIRTTNDDEMYLPALQATEVQAGDGASMLECSSPSKTDYSSYSTPFSTPMSSPANASAWPILTPPWSAKASTSSSVPYGGLSNLGNTCYMASALQMIASLESFTEALKAHEPSKHANLALRAAFLDLVERLQTTNVDPDAFKAAVDDRSSLFLGYRQQDSHEFLTTLLDLLDEDYKKGPPAESAVGAANVESMDVQDETETSADLETVICKKPRTYEPSHLMETDDVDSSTMALSVMVDDPSRSQQSYSELDVDAISRLLHGDGDIILSDVSTTCIIESEQPHYKLVGGRMNTADVMLTPYAEYNASQTHPLQRSEPVASSSGSPRMEMTDDSSAENNDDDEDDDNGAIESPIDTIFTTKVRVRLTCDSCKYTRCHTETFLHLSLEIGSSSDECTNVEDGLRGFFAPCTQELKCEKCFCETATQATEITRLPPALLLHLKRFIVDVSPDWSNVTYRKNQSAVHYDEALTLDADVGALSEFLAADCSMPAPTTTTTAAPAYALRSVVNHIGSSANCGHYTADAKKRKKGESSWKRFNDSYVSEISALQAVEQSRQTAYMCLYELE